MSTKKPAKKKRDPRELTRDVTTRFMMAMGEIIALNKRNATGCKNIKQFAGTINANFSNFSLYEDPITGRNVTLEMCCEICRVHNINGNWLLLGKGERYYNLESLSKVQRLESMVLDVVKRIDSLDKPKVEAPLKKVEEKAKPKKAAPAKGKK